MSDSYIKHGFLAAVYEPWVSFEGSEWGDCMTLLWQAYERGYIWSDEQKDVLEKILRDHLNDAAASFFFSEGDYDSMYEDEVLQARLQYPATVEYWQQRAGDFSTTGGPETFTEVQRSIPEWMRPPPSQEINDAKRAELYAKREKLMAILNDLDAQIEVLDHG